MSKHKLLLADDSVTIQKVINLTFANEGIEVITVGDGNSAMEKFVELAPDLVMVDVNMPGFDGYRICEMIKQDEETNQIPVILLVGSFEPFDEAEARRVGADDYLTKPFQSIRQLVSRVSDLLNRSSGETSSYNQDNFSSKNQAAEVSVTDSGNRPEITSDMNFETFDDAGMDDEMIQTNQIGSLPADESQKFISESHFQTSENDFVYSGADEKEDSAENQPLTAVNFELTGMDSAEIKTEQLGEEANEFVDEQPVAQENELEVLERETLEDREFPEYSSLADNNENTLSDADFNVTAQPRNAPIFDFDDLNLLELPPLYKEPAPATEQETRTAETPKNFQHEKR